MSISVDEAAGNIIENGSSFFGGEPLLEFNLIKDVIEYVEKKALEIEFQKRYHIVYRLTTNGYLLKDEFVEFFKSKDCLLDVSLDGPKEEHDKFRVTRNGQKTWNRIMYNLQKIKKRYPEYYEKNVSYIATIHPHHNGKAIDGFFINNRDLFNEEKVRINNVDIERLKENERKFFIKKFETKSELELRQAMDQLGLKFNFKTIQANSSFTGTCFPGSEKFFVSSSGELNICEKASELCPKIGHVNTGFDFDGIRKILRDYNEKIIENRCWECEQWFLCGVCIINAFINGRFEFNCSIKKSYSYLLKQYIERREDDEKKYSYSINSNNNSIVDFIEQL
ncbi:MAG: radical SAM protein [Acidobacteria bacterium]|nr:radical SAM protein [Acidobacteriota bacterium]